MLGKLLKYDLKSRFKHLAIFYGLAVFFAILTRLLFLLQGSIFWNVVGHIMSGTTIAMIANIVINNLMWLWVRFKANLYGDESYLTHTLPVKRSDLYLSKFLVGLITVFTSTLVIFGVVMLAYYTPENFVELKTMLMPFAEAMDTTVVKMILALVLIVFLEILAALMAGYLGIILGHRKLTNKTAWSVGFGFLVYLIMQMVVMVGIMVLGLVDTGVRDLIFSGDGTLLDVGAFKAITIVASMVYIIMIGVNYCISQRVFRKLDVE